MNISKDDMAQLNRIKKLQQEAMAKETNTAGWMTIWMTEITIALCAQEDPMLAFKGFKRSLDDMEKAIKCMTKMKKDLESQRAESD